MKKIIIFISAILVLILGYWFISPFFIDKRISEDLPTANVVPQNSDTTTTRDIQIQRTVDTVSQVQDIKKGNFTGFDRVHTGSGTARVVTVGDAAYIRFEEDFTVNNGPDLYVGLGKNGSYIKGSELGKLKGTIGSQNYKLPDNIRPTDVEEVWVWCKAFSVPFAKAVFK